MVADSVSARRPALSRASRGLIRRGRLPLPTLLAGLFVAASILFLPALAPAAATGNTSSPTERMATDADPSLEVTVAPTTSTLLRPGENLQLTVSFINPTRRAVGPGTLNVYLAERALTGRTSLENWLRPETVESTGDLMRTFPVSQGIPAGATVTQRVTVPAASVPLGTVNAWGARGVAATFSATGTSEVLAEGRGTFVWYLGEVVTPVKLAGIVPLTTPPQSTGLISAADLEEYTGQAGGLTRQLDGLVNSGLAIALDPMIPASIRILGNAAPPEALAWLKRLDLATNDIFPLGYADADPALAAQAGATKVPTPLSFEYAIDPSRFTAPPATEAPTATPTPTKELGATPRPSDQSSASPNPSSPGSVPDPTPPPSDGSPPSDAELLDWDYTRTDVVWPQPGQVARADLDVFAASGDSTTILAGSNVEQSDSVTPNAALTLERGGALVADDALSAAIAVAAAAPNDVAWSAAVAEASSLLAIVSAEDPGAARTLLAAFDRGWASSPGRLGQTLAALDTLPWFAPASLDTALGAEPATTVSFDSKAEPEDRVAAARDLLGREAEVEDFATALSRPLELTGQFRLEVLALLGTQWAKQGDTWKELVDNSQTKTSAVLSAVSVTTRGPINVAADKVDFPISLSNQLDQAVTVRLQVVPSNGRLLVGSDIETTIEANSATRMTVPVTAAVGNGEVTLRVTMFSAAGVEVGVPALIAVNVHADWEGIGATVLALAAILFFGFGILRNIARRRRERAPSAEPTTTEASPRITGKADPVTEPDV